MRASFFNSFASSRLAAAGRRLAQRGFTLYEVIVATVLIGLLTVMLAPSMRTFLTTQTLAAQQRALDINQNIAKAMLDFAEANDGRLPAPHQASAAGINFGIAPTTGMGTSTLTPFLLQHGLPPALFNGDGTTGDRVRSYQMVQEAATAHVPLFGNHGPLMTLTYDFGVIYQTDCPRSNTTCNASGQVPRDLGGAARSGHFLLAAGQHAQFRNRPSDTAIVFVSTLELERRRLEAFAQQINEIRTVMAAYRAAGRQRCPNTALNDPYPNGVYMFANTNPVPMCIRGCPGVGHDCDRFIDANDPRWPSPSAATHEKNFNRQGCWDGWYRLGQDLNQEFLRGLGLRSVTSALTHTLTTAGFTPWGGVIEYCADYEPLATSGYTADAAPHVAALRFAADVRNPTVNLGFLSPYQVVVISW